MKKMLLPIFLLVSLSFCFYACTDNKYKPQQIKNTIYSKNDCIQEARELLQTNDIYFFDWDFSNLDDINIIDTSYNISVWAMNYNEDKTLNRQIIDLSKQASVYIVTNYKIESKGTAFGFSITSKVMETGSKHYKNNVLQYETQNEIYTATTFSSFSELTADSVNGGIYSSNNTITEISVSDNFYPQSLTQSINPVKYYQKITGTLNNLSVTHTPVHIITHYADYDSFNNDKNFNTMKKITDYMEKTAKYIRN